MPGRSAVVAWSTCASTRKTFLPASADAHHELALVLGGLKQWDQAVRHEEEALRLRPDFAEAREHLAWLRGQ